MASKRKPKMAASMYWGACPCGCGSGVIELLDHEGNVFAKALIERFDLLHMADALCTIAEHPMPPQRQLAS